MWHETDKDVPPVGKVIVGLIADVPVKCYRQTETQWWDVEHQCPCWTAPEEWTEGPDDWYKDGAI